MVRGRQAGTLTGGGDTAEIGGPLTIEIAEGSLTGPLTGIAGFHDADPDGEVTTTEGHFSGTGTFNPDAHELFLNVTVGGGNGYIYGFLDTGLESPGTLTLPVEEGHFCD
jgi:hypothetical protein